MKKTKSFKRNIALLIVVSMLVAFALPMTAVAAEEVYEAQIIDAYGSVIKNYTSVSGQTVVLGVDQTLKFLSDVNLTSAITVKGDGTGLGYIDGGNHTISRTSGTIFNFDGAMVTVDGGRYETTDYAIRVIGNSVFIVADGAFISTKGTAVNLESDGSTAYVIGGYFYAKNRNITSTAGTEHDVRVYGGTFVSETGVCVRIDHGALTLEGGNLYAKGFASDGISYGVVGNNITFGNFYMVEIANMDGTRSITYKGELRDEINMEKGAAVRLVNDGNGHGLRFTTYFTPELISGINKIKDYGTEITFGTLIAPTESVRRLVGFTADALKGAGLTSNIESPSGYDYAMIDAKNGIEGDDQNGYTIRCALTGLKNNLREFSAVPYVKYKILGHDVYAYGTYTEKDNSRSMALVAFRALSDARPTGGDGFNYLNEKAYSLTYGDITSFVSEGWYLPYGETERNILMGYVPDVDIKLFSFLGQGGMEGYKIVIPTDARNYEKSFAIELARNIKEVSHYNIPIITAAESVGSKEIYVRTKAQTGELEFSVTVNGDCIELSSDSLYGFEIMQSYVLELILSGATDKAGNYEALRKRFSDELDGGRELIYGRSGEIRIMSHNVCGWEDVISGPQGVRNSTLYDTYLEYAPDILCLQEVTARVRDDADFPLITKLCAEGGYSEVNVGNVTGWEYGEKSGILPDEVNYVTATPILYNSDVLKVIDKGVTKFGVYSSFNEAFSSKESDLTKSANADKFATWAVFSVLDKNGNETDEIIAVVSVHLSHLTDNYRTAQAKVVKEIAASIVNKHGCPVLLAGDMNAPIGSAVHKNFTGSEFYDVWTDMAGSLKRADEATHYIAKPKYNADTGLYEREDFHVAYGSYERTAIDHIMYYNNGNRLKLRTFDIVSDGYAMTGSDHAGLLLDFDFDGGLSYIDSEYSKNY